MITYKNILGSIKKAVCSVEPEAIVILFGSIARGDSSFGSDIDILILCKRNNLSREVIKKIKYLIYDIEFETGKIISPLILSQKIWETRHKITPFYENVKNEGIRL